MGNMQMMSKWMLLLVSMMWIGNCAATSNSYVILCPEKIRPGVPFTVGVHILLSSGDVTIVASIGTDKNSPQVTNTASFMEGLPGRIELTLPTNYDNGQNSVSLYVTGSGGLMFENETVLTVELKSMSILIQTDKGIYKPGQTVHFRALAISPHGLSTYHGAFDVLIKDPNGNVIEQWKDLTDSDGFGVIEKDMVTSTEPVLGSWTIIVTATDNGVSAERQFDIDEYVLPKFEVTLTLPPFLEKGVNSAAATVKAEYTYGKPVKGLVVITLSMGYGNTIYMYDDGMSNGAKLRQITIPNLDGSADFEIKKSDLEYLNSGSYPEGQTLSIIAVVTETLTGLNQNTTSDVECYDKPIKVEFLDLTPENFKPGLSYTAYVSVTLQDGNPLRTSDMKRVYISTQYDNTGTPLQVTKTVPDSGVVTLTLTIPTGKEQLEIKAWYYDDTQDWYKTSHPAKKALSPSESYLQLTTDTDKLTAGNRAMFTVTATEPVFNFIFEVKSRGNIVRTGTVNADGSRTKTFELSVSTDMAPTAKLIVYYVRGTGEVVVDTMNINVDGTFENQVSLSLSTDVAAPADSVNLIVTADPVSYIALLAVDTSVLLLRSGNDITQDQVLSLIKAASILYCKYNMQYMDCIQELRNLVWEALVRGPPCCQIPGYKKERLQIPKSLKSSILAVAITSLYYFLTEQSKQIQCMSET